MQCEEALNWAMHVPTLALAQRCVQVARAQAPALSPALVDTLLSALMQCMLYPSGASFDFVTEVLEALRELLDSCDEQQARPPQLPTLPKVCRHSSKVLPPTSVALHALTTL